MPSPSKAKKKNTSADVVVVGGGLAGMTMSAALGRRGLSVICLDQAPLQGPPGEADLRTTAISYGSQKILHDAGIWQKLSGKTCPIEDIRVLDGHSPVLLQFLSTDINNKAFGWIVLNSDLRRAMQETMNALPYVMHRPKTRVQTYEVQTEFIAITLESGEILKAKLLIGADGRQSTIRARMNVRTRTWSYGQQAVICTIHHEYSHHNTAVEHFWPEGPFAILPMADDDKGRHRSSIVFTEHKKRGESLMALSDQAFNAALAVRVPPEYGKIQMIGRRAAYPLSLVHAESYIAPRLALVADAAHGIHPIAGQGLNLGFRDIKALADLIGAAYAAGEDIGAPGLLAAYQRQRRFDNMAMVAVTDGLVRLFSNRLPGVGLLRKAGLKAVSKLPAAKRFFMHRAMGE